MRQALDLAQRGRYTVHPNPAVGCVIVDPAGDVAIGEGWHQRAGEPHAEVHALNQAGSDARGATVYVTLEPCAHVGRTAPCADALIRDGVERVVYAAADPNPKVAGQGAAALRRAGVEVCAGLLAEESRQLNRGFMSRFERGRPFVTLKLGMSLDGRTAMASGESQWITGAAARADVHRLRAESGAVLTGMGTVLADDPQLTVRHDRILAEPARIVFDSRRRIDPGARLLQGAGRKLVVSAAPARGDLPADVEQLEAGAGGDGRLDLARAFAALAGAQINSVLLECGPTLAGAALQAGLVDELVVYLAPMLLGDAARGLVTLPGLERLAQAPQLEISAIEPVGMDWRIIARPIQ